MDMGEKQLRLIGRRDVRLDIRSLLRICTGVRGDHFSTDSRGQKKIIVHDILEKQRSLSNCIIPSLLLPPPVRFKSRLSRWCLLDRTLPTSLPA